MADNIINCQPSCYGRFAVIPLAANRKNCCKAGSTADTANIFRFHPHTGVICAAAVGKVGLGGLCCGGRSAAAAVVQIGYSYRVIDTGHISPGNLGSLYRVDGYTGTADSAGAVQGQHGGNSGVYAVFAATTAAIVAAARTGGTATIACRRCAVPAAAVVIAAATATAAF